MLGLVTMITVWQTAFPAYDVPSAIAYVQVGRDEKDIYVYICVYMCV